MKNIVNTQDSPLMEAYFKQIKSIPLLSADEESELSKRIQQGDEAARKKLIEANLRLVIKIARLCWMPNVSLMDIIQEGNIGLIHAAEKFDYTKNARFSTYASWWIKQTIRRYFANKQRIIRLPNRKEEILKKIKAVQQTLCQKLMREPTTEEIADELKIKAEEVALILKVTCGTVSLEAEINDDNYTAIDMCEDYTYNPEKEFFQENMKEDIRHYLKSLKEKERRVVIYRFQLDGYGRRTLKNISAKMHISPETVRQIEMRALKNIKHQINECNGNYY